MDSDLNDEDEDDDEEEEKLISDSACSRKVSGHQGGVDNNQMDQDEHHDKGK